MKKHGFTGYSILALVIIGALNWGLVGLFRFDLVAAIFGQMSMVSRVIYTLVGLAGAAKLVHLFGCKCDKK